MPSETSATPVDSAPAQVDEQQQSQSQQRMAAIAPDWEYRHQPTVVLYEALTARVGHRDALLWQSPALAMTAQAFLLVVALGHDSSPTARFVAALLGVFVTLMSIQLMLKHRMYMNNDQVTMVALERRMELPGSAIDYATQLSHLDQAEPEQRLASRAMRKRGLTLFPSVTVWISGLTVFGVVNVLLMIFAFHDALGVPCGWTSQSAVDGSRCLVAL